MLLCHSTPISSSSSILPRPSRDAQDSPRLPKSAAYDYHYSAWSENMALHYPSYHYSPPSSPPHSRAQLSFPQPTSAPHDQPAFANQSYSRYGSTRPAYPQCLDRRMSEPALLSGNHPAAYRVSPSTEQSSRYPNPYSPSPSDSYYHPTSRTYTEHSHNDSNGSAIAHFYGADNRSCWATEVKQEETYPESKVLNYSPRPSTGSTCVEDISPLPTYSASGASPSSGVSVSPDMPSTNKQSVGQHNHPSSPSNSSKTYAFVSLPGTTIRKRPRRRYDEIERLYHCSWPECTKAYGTLNHLNAHVVMQKHGLRRLPSEFKELRKQWRKAKKEGTFTSPAANPIHSATTPSSGGHYSLSTYYDGLSNERKRRMTDPNLPSMPGYRSADVFHPSLHTSSNLEGSGWVEEQSERRYSTSLSYPPHQEGAVVEEVYGSYSESSSLPDHESSYRPSSTMLQSGYSAHTSSSNQQSYGNEQYSYPLPSPPAGYSSQEQDVPVMTSDSSSSNHHYRTIPPISSMPPSNSTLGRLSSESTLLAPLQDYRSAEENKDKASSGTRSKYEEHRGSYDQSYGYNRYENETEVTPGQYSLGRNRLPRDSTLLTPLNPEHIRYGNGKGL